MKKKDFDCVEMKRKGQEALRKRLAGLTPEQIRAYWEEQDQQLRDHQQRLRSENPTDPLTDPRGPESSGTP